MRIREMRITPVAVPDPPLWNAAGVHQPFALRSIVELIADNGLIGLGEGYGGARALAALEAARAHVLGADPYELSRLEALIDRRAFAPIEVALLDLIGKATDRPVCDLLGGRLRDRVEFAAYLFFKYAADERYRGEDPWGEVMTPAAMVGEARRFVEQWGFRVLKLKGGVLSPRDEVETIRRLHAAFPEHKLRIDPNASWSVETSVAVAEELARLNVDYVEDPTRGMEGMAELRRRITLPLATNMCVTAFEHLPDAVRLEPVDVILTDHHFWGGLRATVRLSYFCRDFGLGVSMHSNTHLGISLAAMLHVGTAMPHVTHALDTHYPWLAADVITEPWQFRDACLSIRDAPGLGVELDRDRLAAMHQW
ncbi:MAG TPA: enolase C-terminal domain-like protein, partial [Limnochordia bacterium]